MSFSSYKYKQHYTAAAFWNTLWKSVTARSRDSTLNHLTLFFPYYICMGGTTFHQAKGTKDVWLHSNNFQRLNQGHNLSLTLNMSWEILQITFKKQKQKTTQNYRLKILYVSLLGPHGLIDCAMSAQNWLLTPSGLTMTQMHFYVNTLDKPNLINVALCLSSLIQICRDRKIFVNDSLTKYLT